jgi:TusE/DsrC/DsvC family sulfur relay protein
MMSLETVQTDAEGYLADREDWSEELAQEYATQMGIELTDEHWKVINTARAIEIESGSSPGLRKISKRSETPIKSIYKLFPDGPAKLVAKIAGIPKPKARMAGVDARLFFTFWGLDIVNKKKIDHLHLNLVGNPSAPIPAMIAGLPGVEALATAQMRKEMERLEIPPIREFIEMLDDAGADLYGCQMALDMFKLTKDDLVPQVKEVLTAMDFMDMSEGAQRRSDRLRLVVHQLDRDRHGPALVVEFRILVGLWALPLGLDLSRHAPWLLGATNRVCIELAVAVLVEEHRCSILAQARTLEYAPHGVGFDIDPGSSKRPAMLSWKPFVLPKESTSHPALFFFDAGDLQRHDVLCRGIVVDLRLQRRRHRP